MNPYINAILYLFKNFSFITWNSFFGSTCIICKMKIYLKSSSIRVYGIQYWIIWFLFQVLVLRYLLTPSLDGCENGILLHWQCLVQDWPRLKLHSVTFRRSYANCYYRRYQLGTPREDSYHASNRRIYYIIFRPIQKN